MIPIYLQILGKKTCHYINPNNTIKEFNEYIENIYQYKINKIIYAGKILDINSNKKIKDYDIKKEACINILTIGKKIINKIDEKILHIKFDENINIEKIDTTTNLYVVINKNECYIYSLYNDIETTIILKKNNIILNKKININELKEGQYTIDFDNLSIINIKTKININIKNIHPFDYIKTSIKNGNFIENIDYNKKMPIEILKEIYNTINENTIDIINIMINYYKNHLKTKYIKISNLKSSNLLIMNIVNKEEKYVVIEINNMINLIRVLILLEINKINIEEEYESYNGNYTKCNKCNELKKNNILYGKKIYCYKCLIDTVKNNLRNKNNNIIDKYFYEYIDKKDRDEILDIIINNSIKNKITCVKCNEVYEYIGNNNKKYSPKIDILNREMINKYRILYSYQRIKCMKCHTEFCKDCKIEKYHSGYRCDEYKEYINSPKCRFCLDSLSKCNNMICKLYDNVSENKKLKCGHTNYGINGYDLCLICEGVYDDDCTICMSNKLYKKPCIKIDCDHIFHYECITTKINMKYNTEFISLNYLNCSICQFKISHESLNNGEVIKQTMNYNISMEKLTKKYIKENNCKEEIKDVINKMRYYECSKCNKVYFGGLADCQGEENRPETEKICMNCNVLGKEKCKLHDNKYLLVKCNYCCNIAVWLCNDINYCQRCHDELLKYHVTEKECVGNELCPLKGNHPPNDGKSKVAIGCSICLDNEHKQRMKLEYAKR